MKWKHGLVGARRIRRFFAILPYDCEDGFTRWLEFIWKDEYFYENCSGSGWMKTRVWK
jgi:hypothetical protein